MLNGLSAAGPAVASCLCLDLERYDFTKGSTSLIRATEGTIIERLPPRMKIRSGAVLELPHILVLIDDPEQTVIEPVEKARGRAGKTLRFRFDAWFRSPDRVCGQ